MILALLPVDLCDRLPALSDLPRLGFRELHPEGVFALHLALGGTVQDFVDHVKQGLRVCKTLWRLLSSGVLESLYASSALRRVSSTIGDARSLGYSPLCYSAEQVPLSRNSRHFLWR